MSGTGVARPPAPPTGTEAAARVADVLVLLAEEARPLGITEIARTLGAAKATVHRVIRSLESRELVVPVEDGGPYALGPAAAIIGARALQRFDFRGLARPVLHRLQAETEETATVSALIGHSRVYLEQIVSLREIKMTVELGRPFPLHAGASSKAVLAFAPDALVESALSSLAPLTPVTVVDRHRLEAELDEIRRRGVAVSRGERQTGAASVAAPVFDRDGAVMGAVSVCGPIDRFTDSAVDRYRDLVRAAAEDVTAACRR